MRSRLPTVLLLLVCLSALSGCAGLAPKRATTLQLSPAGLGAEVALQQQLTVEVGGHSQTFDALIEVSDGEMRLLVQAMGRTAFLLEWDGQSVREERAEWLPEHVKGQQVLEDLQIALWPVDALRSGLPSGWTLTASDQERVVFMGDEQVVHVQFVSANEFVLDRPGAGYRLRVQSVAAQGIVP